MQRSYNIQKIALLAGLISIAALPLLFVRLFTFYGFQVSVFHITAIVFIVLSFLAFGFKLKSGTSSIEKAILIFLCAVLLYAIFPTPHIKGLIFVAKLVFYVVYFRLLLVAFASTSTDVLLKLLKISSVSGLLFFALNFSLAFSIDSWGIPFEEKKICPEYSIDELPESLRYAPQKQSDFLLNVTVPILATFDEIWPANMLCRSRDIGINALAGVFLLYLNILLVSPKLKNYIRYTLVSLCALFIAIMDSRATLLLLGCTILWVVITKFIKNITFQRTWSILSILLALMIIAALSGVILLPAWESITSSARYAQYSSSLALIFQDPVVGKGLGYKLKMDGYELYPHNCLLSSWLMMGLVGLIASLTLLATLAMKLGSSIIRGLGDNKANQQISFIPIFLFAPIATLLIRASAESIFMLSDWVSLVIYLLLFRESPWNRSTILVLDKNKPKRDHATENSRRSETAKGMDDQPQRM